MHYLMWEGKKSHEVCIIRKKAYLETV